MNQLDINPYLVTSVWSLFSNNAKPSQEHKTSNNAKPSQEHKTTTELQKYKILSEKLEKEVCANMEDEIKEKEKVYAFLQEQKEYGWTKENQVQKLRDFFTERVKL
jgi:hypothetical protein